MPARIWDIGSVCALMCKTIIAPLSRQQRQWGRVTQKINVLSNPNIRDSWQENAFDYLRYFGKVSVVVCSWQNCKWPWKDQYRWSCWRGKTQWWVDERTSIEKCRCKMTKRNGEAMENAWCMEGDFWMGNIKPSILSLQVKCKNLISI